MKGDLSIVGIRDALPEDHAYYIDAWLMSFRMSHFAGPISMDRYREIYAAEIERLTTRPEARVHIAYNNGRTQQIFGFLCFENGFADPVIHYAHTKKPFRRHGIFETLCKNAGINLQRRFLYTYRTPMACSLTNLGAVFERGKFEPRIARFVERRKDGYVQSEIHRSECADADPAVPDDPRIPSA